MTPPNRGTVCHIKTSTSYGPPVCKIEISSFSPFGGMHSFISEAMRELIRVACCCVWHIYSDVDWSIMERGDLVPCDDVTCQGRSTAQGQEVTRACDVTRSTCVCSRGFVVEDDRCVGWSSLSYLQ